MLDDDVILDVVLNCLLPLHGILYLIVLMSIASSTLHRLAREKVGGLMTYRTPI